MLPLLTLVLLGFALGVTTIAVTTEHHVRAARAAWAADAAARAVAAVGPTTAEGAAAGRAVAEANGARLLSVVVAPDPAPGEGPVPPSGAGRAMSPIVVIEVDYGGSEARAAAQRYLSGQP